MNELKLAKLLDQVQHKHNIPAASALAIFDLRDVAAAHNLEKIITFPELMDVVIKQAVAGAGEAASPQARRRLLLSKSHGRAQDAMQLLLAMCRTKSLQRAMFDYAGVVDAIVSNLLLQDDGALALLALDALLANNKTNRRLCLARAGEDKSVMPALLSLVGVTGDESRRKTALRCLTSLAQDVENRRVLVADFSQLVSFVANVDHDNNDDPSLFELLALLACHQANVPYMVMQRPDLGVAERLVKASRRGDNTSAGNALLEWTRAVAPSLVKDKEEVVEVGVRYWGAVLTAWTLCSARQMRRLGGKSPVRHLPVELVRELFRFLV